MLDIMPEYGDFLDYYKGKHYGITLSLRYRLSNRLQLKYSGYYADDNYNIGFATFSEDGSVLYGGRSLITTTNSIGFSYVIRYGMNVTVDARHYRNAGFYKHYYNLQEDGFLCENTEYNNNLSFNYNSFYINFLYSWEFAPGSRLTLSYKNQIEAEDQLTSADYISDIRNTLNAPQMNIVSLKVLYYLDYATLSKRKKRG